MSNDILELKYGVVYYIKDAKDEIWGPMQVKLVGPPPELFNTIINVDEYHGDQIYKTGKYKYRPSKDSLELRVGGKYKINDKIYELESQTKNAYNQHEFKYGLKLISSDILKNPSSEDQNQIIQKLKEELNNLKEQLANKTKEIQELQQKLTISKTCFTNPLQPQHQNNEFQIFDSNDLSKFEKIEEIGFGDGGKVFKVASKSFYALKEMNIKNVSMKNFKYFIREYELMKNID